MRVDVLFFVYFLLWFHRLILFKKKLILWFFFNLFSIKLFESRNFNNKFCKLTWINSLFIIQVTYLSHYTTLSYFRKLAKDFFDIFFLSSFVTRLPLYHWNFTIFLCYVPWTFTFKLDFTWSALVSTDRTPVCCNI
jgi:hypothetical protein